MEKNQIVQLKIEDMLDDGRAFGRFEGCAVFVNGGAKLPDDKKAAVWVGTIDDLWTLGKPRGEGGPWKNSKVHAGEYSDPYLIAFYDKKKLTIEHNSATTVNVTVEIDPTGCGDWMEYQVLSVESNTMTEFVFPDALQAKWVRMKTDADTYITTWFVYE